jgi:predicted nucleotidyltransferase
VIIDQEIEQIKNVLVETISPVKIYLFGSYADGTAKEDSDYDFYIIVKDGMDDLADLTAQAYKSIHPIKSRSVDIVIGTERRFESRKHRMTLENEVCSKGVLLYG